MHLYLYFKFKGLGICPIQTLFIEILNAISAIRLVVGL